MAAVRHWGSAAPIPVFLWRRVPAATGNFPTGCPDANLASCAPVNARGLFDDQVAVTLTETFETRTVGQLSGSSYVPPNVMTVFGSGNTLSQAAPIGDGLLRGRVREGTTQFGRFNTTNGALSGRWFETDSAFTIDLAAEVDALGFYGTDFGDFSGSLSIALYDVDGNTVTLVQQNVFTSASGGSLPLGNQDGSLLFFGFASDVKFNRAVLSITQGSGITSVDFLGFDDIVVGNLRNGGGTNPAPEPGSLALVGLALFAASWARKTQRRA